MTKKEQKIKDIESAAMLIESGINSKSVNPPEVREMMKKIAANAVIIGLFNFNGFVISNISDGDFDTIREKDWKETRDDLNRRLGIIDNKGENLKDLLGVEEIKEAVKYTIFEETGDGEEDEQTNKKS